MDELALLKGWKKLDEMKLTEYKKKHSNEKNDKFTKLRITNIRLNRNRHIGQNGVGRWQNHANCSFC